MKPGKPNYFGTRGKKLVFGLPGNPVSALVSFETLVIPALNKMLGILPQQDPYWTATIDDDVRKVGERIEFIRAIASRTSGGTFTVRPVQGQGSHMIGGLAKANCLLIFPKGRKSISKGESVSIRPLRWSLL